MSEKAAEKYQIVLEKVPYERQPDAALFLSGCFSLPPPSTMSIANSGPIVLVSDMGREQADAVLAELSLSVPNGVTLRLAGEKESTNISRLQWPRPPRIYGKDLAEFAETGQSHELQCPLCGGLLRITASPEGVKAAPAFAERKPDSSRRLLPANDNDPLFSGIKPVSSASSGLSSLRSLSAGDTGFWVNYDPPPPPPPISHDEQRSGETTDAKRSTGRLSSGLAAFMKPGAFAVVVGRTKDSQAVKMIAEIMGLSEDEAREKCLKLGLCVARDISLDEAQNLLARFQGLGTRARIVRPA